MDYLTQCFHRYQEKVIEQQELSLEATIAADNSPPALLTCGQCANYVQPRTLKSGRQTWGYCALRAQVDIHPCNLPPFDEWANECRWFDGEVPF